MITELLLYHFVSIWFESALLGLCRLSYDETDDDMEWWSDDLSDLTLDAGELVWALAFGSYAPHTNRHSTSLNWASSRDVGLMLATGLQSGIIKIWHVSSRKYGQLIL